MRVQFDRVKSTSLRAAANLVGPSVSRLGRILGIIRTRFKVVNDGSEEIEQNL